MKRSELVTAAEELNKVLGLDPAIDIKMKVKDLKNKMIEAGELIDPTDDEFTSETWTVLESIGAATRPAPEYERGQEEQEAKGDEEFEEPEAEEETVKELEEPEPEPEPEQPTKKTKPAGTTGSTGTKKKSSTIERTAFGSKKGSSAAAIDEAIIALKEATVSEITEKAGCKKSRADSHVRSLLTKGKIVQEKKEGTIYYKPSEE